MSDVKTYRPELLSRRGELTAWSLAGCAALGLYLLSLGGPVPLWTWFFVLLLVFSALSISLGNWVDRRTCLCLEPDGLTFENGLRQVHLTWTEIRAVRTAPARWGTSVQVLGERAHFAFTTLGEVRFQGETRGQTGFVAGQFIQAEILRQAGLLKMIQAGPVCIYSRD